MLFISKLWGASFRHTSLKILINILFQWRKPHWHWWNCNNNSQDSLQSNSKDFFLMIHQLKFFCLGKQNETPQTDTWTNHTWMSSRGHFLLFYDEASMIKSINKPWIQGIRYTFGLGTPESKEINRSDETILIQNVWILIPDTEEEGYPTGMRIFVFLQTHTIFSIAHSLPIEV